MLGSLNTASLASAGTLDVEVQRWISAVEKDGGSASAETLEALNEFIITLKTKNIRNKIYRCNLFCGASHRSAIHPIIVSDHEYGKIIGNEKDKSFGFFDNDYSEISGLSAADSTLNVEGSKYLETGVFVTSMGMSSNEGHLAFMSSDQNVSLDAVGGYMMPICGGDYSLSSSLSSYIEFGSDKILKAASPSSFSPAATKGHAEIENVNEVGGFWVASRLSSTNQRLYKDSIQYDNGDATADQALNISGGYKFRIFGAYSGGQVTQTSKYKLLFYSIGKGLTITEIENLDAALKEFNTKLNRT